jgi:hypothetical protein
MRLLMNIFLRLLGLIGYDPPVEYVSGTPSYEESRKLWRRFPRDSDIESEEYEDAANSLTDHLKKRYLIFDYDTDGDLYVRGDFFGDRTQYLEFYLPELISEDFFKYLQEWLCEYENGAWRILIPTYLSDAATIMVYPNVVRLGREYEDDLPASYARIVQMMRAADTEGSLKR